MKLTWPAPVRILLNVMLTVLAPVAVVLIDVMVYSPAYINAGMVLIVGLYLLMLAARILLGRYIRKMKEFLPPPFYAEFSPLVNNILLWSSIAAFIVVYLPFLFMGVTLLAHGSMEMFPTEEQQGKAYIGGFLLTYVCAVVGVLLLPPFIRFAAYIHKQKKLSRISKE